MDNGPISASAPGTSLTDATGKNVTFNTKYPFAKIDSTKKESFQTITVFFSIDTPTPPSPLGFSATNKTLVYSYPHGYDYVPSTWFLLSTDNFSNVLGSEGVWIVGNATGFSPAIAQFIIEVDDTHVKFYIYKFWLNDGITAPPSVLGFFVSIRAYIFVEDLTGNSVPSHV